MRADTPVSESHDAFLRMLPRIRQFAARRFRDHGAEAREELTAEAVALAFDTYRRLVERGLPELTYPAPLATFACRQVVSGRRLGGCRNVNDIGSPACEQRHGVRVTSLQRPGADSGRWCELLVEDRTAGPADIAAARIDFRSWLDSLPPRQRQLATTLATGESTGRVARLFRVSAGRISQLRRELHTAWLQFQGEPVAAALRR